MTEDQLFPMSADFFDTSSNSSNPLKFDLYTSLGLSGNSNSSNGGLFGSAASFLPTLSPPPHLTILTGNQSSANSPISSGSSSGSLGGSASGQNSATATGSGSGVTGGPSNVMLTNAITIPRSNNPNQSHPHPQHHISSSFQDDKHILMLHHHTTSPSPLQNPTMMTQHNQQQQQHQQQQQQAQQPQQQQQQQQQQQHRQGQQHQLQSPTMLADLSEYGLDALDASSLSPTLLQDVSLSAATSMHNNSNSVTPTITSSGLGSNGASSFYTHDISSPMSQHNMNVAGLITSDTHTLLSLNTSLNDDVNNPLIYEVHDATPHSNSLWSDIGSAIISTKNEPFTLEEDYIFPIDKTGAGFPDILEDFSNIEEFLPAHAEASTTSASNTPNNGFMLSPQSTSSLHQLGSPQASPGGPPLELLQLQQHQLTQLQSLQSSQPFSSSNGSSSNNSAGGGAIHHNHHLHHSSSSPYDIYHSTPNKQQQQQSQSQQQHQLNNNSSTSNTFSPGSQSSHSPLQQLNSSITPPPPRAPHYPATVVKSRNMQDLIKKGFSMSPDRSSAALLGQSVPGSHILLSGNALSPSSGSSGFGSTTGGSNSGSVRKSFVYQGDTASSRLSSSAPTHLGSDLIWMRREPRQHLLSTGSLAEAESYSSLSTGSVLSPEGVDLSQDDDEDGSTDYNSDHYDEFSSDGSDNDDDTRTSTPHQHSMSKGKERFFWQYNVQAKGPKGKRLVFQSKIEDPHVLNEVTDPVFSPNCSVRGIKVYKHSGKARKGDGNDLTPNPRKLNNIGKELDKLSRTINDMTPVSELPFNVRPKSRKEKNKLASRACRLKKKAQHEANKIKLYGLEIEHRRLLNGIAEMKQVLALKYINSNEPKEEIDQRIETIYQTAKGIKIAGGTTDFVNKVLENIKNGVPNGGLEELRNS